MAKQTGRKLLIKVGDGEAVETFLDVCGLTTKTLKINNGTYDVTTADCTTPGGQLWQEVKTGTRSISVDGAGLFESGAMMARMIAVSHGSAETDETDAVANFQVIVPGLGTFSGAFHVNEMDLSGGLESLEAGFGLTSSGYTTFTVE